MKLAKLSLAAIVVAGLASSSFAADTLADAFKNGKVSGELKAWYWDRDTDHANNGTAKKGNADIFNTGVVLGYVTDSFYGFKMGATFQANSAPFADDDAKNLYIGDEYGSGSVLSEAYVEYTIGKTMAKVGRQYISTPLVNGSGSRMIKQSFEGALLVNTDLPNTTLAAGYVDKYQNRTDNDGGVGDFEQVGANNDGAYTLLAINKSIPGLTITAQWAQVTDTADVYYAELDYAGTASGFKYGLAAQYDLLDFDAAGVDSGSVVGLKASLGMGDISGWIAYAKVGSDNTVNSGLGGFGLGSGTDKLFTNNIVSDVDAYKVDTESYAANLEYAVNKSAKIGAQYLGTDNGLATNDTAHSLDFYGSYAFDGSLKGLNFYVVYEDAEESDGRNTSELRFNAGYKF